MKYVFFIDPLLREIENSGFTCHISNIPTSPVGYADDLSVCSTSKYNLDNAMKLVCKVRNFTLGKDKEKEKIEYNHAGVQKTVSLGIQCPEQTTASVEDIEHSMLCQVLVSKQWCMYDNLHYHFSGPLLFP